MKLKVVHAFRLQKSNFPFLLRFLWDGYRLLLFCACYEFALKTLSSSLVISKLLKARLSDVSVRLWEAVLPNINRKALLISLPQYVQQRLLDIVSEWFSTIAPS